MPSQNLKRAESLLLLIACTLLFTIISLLPTASAAPLAAAATAAAPTSALTVVLLTPAPPPLPLHGRDVFVPPVLYPSSGAVWRVGGRHNVTWDTSSPPSQITNKYGRIYLVKAGRIDIEHPLAIGFDIMTGRQEVAVPDHVKPDTDYQIVVFGDSGNVGELFTIV